MAERVTSSAIEKLVRQLEKEADLPLEVKDQVRSFQAELKKVSSFLNYSEVHLNQQEVAVLENQIRDVTYAAEDTIKLINELIFNSVRPRRRWRKVGKLFHCFGDKRKLCDATARMVSMNERLKKIRDAKGKERDGGGSGSSHSGGFGMTVEEPDHVVGFDGEAEALVNRLMKDGDLQQNVVSIVGMEGLGKTTLAKKIYNHGLIRAHFAYRAWVPVPQEYKTADLLRCILKYIAIGTSFNHDQEAYEEDASEEELKEVVSGRLRGRRYLIIMDNVWHKQVWDEVKPAFPDDLNGSRILLTSRLEEVASHASPRPPHRLGLLDSEDSWELLRRKALKGNFCRQDLVEIGKQMAKKCDGLPLAIVLLGGILARQEETVETWSTLADNTSKHLLIQGKRGRGIALSYHNLPQHLKTCLLYFGMFPEDYEIPVRQLIQLWIAEGFVQVVKGTQRMEDAGEEYLNELIGQSLIQVVARRTDGGVKTCRILKLLRELCISVAEDQKLFLVNVNADHSNRAGSEPLRLAVHNDHNGFSLMEALSESGNNYQQLCSLQCYAPGSLGHINSIRLWRLLYNSLALLRVLNLGSIKVDRIPRGVKKLLYLQYLRVNAPNLTQIPSSICNLFKLQTLDLRDSSLPHIVPNEIWKMKDLRHVYFGSSASLPDPDNDKALWNLQTLSGVRPDAVLKRLMVKAKFPNVTKLSICSFNKNATSNFLESLDHLYHLQSLKIVNPCEFPDSNAFPLTLSKITLKETYLSAPDCIQTLEKLPNLRILKLLNCSVLGPEINCNVGCFLQLQVLCLVGVETEAWNVRTGAMRSIRRLVIRDCAKLVTVPQFHSSMATLHEVEIFKPAERLRENLLQQIKNPTEFILRIDDALVKA
ncbi:disease resistance protein RPP13-like [Camellia sinensis]|uniref:NB-ARC domain-containing protein n=1 Tax=Camellia sinensis var. sinensis TaxID=542762 RepID=A0A4S4DXN7_CAMSN|nr:disease resistance protein RPP13-like [Camellia sinensis]THG08160.1 hypothetical protein TEA_002600 [Camellia sinensis var. sinensis]